MNNSIYTISGIHCSLTVPGKDPYQNQSGILKLLDSQRVVKLCITNYNFCELIDLISSLDALSPKARGKLHLENDMDHRELLKKLEDRSIFEITKELFFDVFSWLA